MERKNISEFLGRKRAIEKAIRYGYGHAELCSMLDVSHGTMSRLLLALFGQNLTQIRAEWGIVA
jgi:hypothetical protein